MASAAAKQDISAKRLRELEAAPEDFTPANEAEFTAAMANPMWRLNHL